MEVESLFSSTRWDILKALAKNELAPMELAAATNTTSANVSQQLRLLELAGLVKSKKTSNIEKGKPRVIYSLAGDTAFLILSSPNYADKKMLHLSTYHKYILRTWFIENKESHIPLNEFYFSFSDYLNKIDLIAARSNGREIFVVLSKKDAALEKQLESFKKVRVNVIDLLGLQKKPDLIVLYDPLGKSNREVKI